MVKSREPFKFWRAQPYPWTAPDGSVRTVQHSSGRATCQCSKPAEGCVVKKVNAVWSRFGLQVPAEKRLTVSGEPASGATSAIQESHSAAVAEPLTPRKAEMTSKLKVSGSGFGHVRVCFVTGQHPAYLLIEQRCSGWCSKVDKLPTAVQQFVSSQINVNASSVSPLGVCWTHQDKLLAVGLFYESPSAYRFMQRAFRLPTVRTLRTFLCGFGVSVGFDCDYVSVVQTCRVVK